MPAGMELDQDSVQTCLYHMTAQRALVCTDTATAPLLLSCADISNNTATATEVPSPLDSARAIIAACRTEDTSLGNSKQLLVKEDGRASEECVVVGEQLSEGISLEAETVRPLDAFRPTA